MRCGINEVISFIVKHLVWDTGRCLVVTVSLRGDRGEYVYSENACMVGVGDVMDGCSLA